MSEEWTLAKADAERRAKKIERWSERCFVLSLGSIAATVVLEPFRGMDAVVSGLLLAAVMILLSIRLKMEAG